MPPGISFGVPPIVSVFVPLADFGIKRKSLRLVTVGGALVLNQTFTGAVADNNRLVPKSAFVGTVTWKNVPGATTKDCTKALVPDATGALFMGQLAPSLIDGVFYWSNYQGGTWGASVGTNLSNQTISSHSCIAGDAGTNDIWSVSCVTMTGPMVCATGDEKEVGVIPVATTNPALDQTKIAKWGGVVD